VALRIRRRCVVGSRPYVSGGDVSWSESTSPACAEFDDAVLVANWDAIRVESRISDQIGHRIPDIVLLAGGRWVGAIEVFVSHAVDQEKAEMFSRLEVPWVEVEATDALCDRASGWIIDRPLDPRASSMPLAWRCAKHHLARSVERARPGVVAERPPDRSTLKAARIVDLYFAKGTWRRVIYRVRAAYADGILSRVALDRNGQLIHHYPAVRGEAENAFLARVNEVIRRDCDADIASVSRRAAIVDAGRWLKNDSLRLVDDAARVRRQFRFSHVDGEWQRDTTDARQAALQTVESAIRGRRSEVQRSLQSRDD
jgi:hypothetical protein